MRTLGGIGADGCGAAIFGKPSLVLKGIARILRGDQLRVALYLGMVVQRRKHFSRRVAQRRRAALPASGVSGPAVLHIPSFPQTHFGGSGVLHTETNHRFSVRAAEILLAFLLVQLEFFGQRAAQVGQQRAPAQISQQRFEAFRRFGLRAPARELREIPV